MVFSFSDRLEFTLKFCPATLAAQAKLAYFLGYLVGI